jgi:predicted small secreted protein
MKRSLYLISIVTLMSLILSACNASSGLGSDDLPVATEPPAVDTSASLVPIDLAGLPMEVGSKYPYVDGTVLVAVPNGTFIMGYNGSDR